MKELETIITALKTRFQALSSEIVSADQAYVEISKDLAVPALTHLKESLGFVHLSFFTCVDYIEEDRFELLYMVHSYKQNLDLGINVTLPRQSGWDGPMPLSVEMEGIHHIWPAAETYQRELREMYGIVFPGSPRLYDDFALEGWREMPPMRRDFDTKAYSEKTYFARPGRVKSDNRKNLKDTLYPSEAETW